MIVSCIRALHILSPAIRSFGPVRGRGGGWLPAVRMAVRRSDEGEPVDLAWFVKERDERRARREAWLDAHGLALDGDRLVPRGEPS
ncbi:hypothetical protein [Streptomyces sp. NPDC093093]|uniref:hypothetical protein n=1 Tax=Streptomyces sp. NPDC093093 TaxID=3366025 RepID=UPI003821E633